MHRYRTVACVVLGLLVTQAYLKAGDDQDPFLQPEAPAATRPTTRPAWIPDDLQQRRQAAKARHEQELAALQKLLLDGYAASGCTDPKWDDNARKAIRAYSVSKIDELDDGSALFAQHLDAFWASQAGCGDSLVEYIFERMQHWISRPTADDDRRQIEAGLRLQESEYPDGYKMVGLLRTMQFFAMDTAKSGKSHQQEIADARAQVLDIAQKMAKAPPVPRYELITLLTVAGEASYTANQDSMKWPAEIVTVLGDGYRERSSLLTAEASVWISSAWDARRDGTGEPGTDVFAERIGRAEKLLAEAWGLDHDNVPAAKYMIVICKCTSQRRPTMEKWFKAAVAGDPDSLSAYTEKLDYLEPRWSGSEAELVGFGRECLALPDDCERRLTIVDVYYRLSQYGNPNPMLYPYRGYFTKHSDTIWPDIQAAYEPYIKACGLSEHNRLHYARLALWCNQPDKARELLRNYTKWPGHAQIGSDEVDAMRKELGMLGRAPAAK